MRLRPTPPAVPSELTEQFGTPEIAFGPNLRFRLMAAACGVIFLVLGIAFGLLGWAGLPLADWVSSRLAIPLLVLGLVVLIGTRLVPLNWVFVCPGGVVRTQGAAWDAIGWADVERFEDATLGHKGVTVRQCRLVLKGGGEWGFLADYVAEYGRLAEVLRKRIAERDSSSPGPAEPKYGLESE